jgi:hypothetical protein
MKLTLALRKKLRRGELRLKVEVDFWRLLAAFWFFCL